MYIGCPFNAAQQPFMAASRSEPHRQAPGEHKKMSPKRGRAHTSQNKLQSKLPGGSGRPGRNLIQSDLAPGRPLNLQFVFGVCGGVYRMDFQVANRDPNLDFQVYSHVVVGCSKPSCFYEVLGGVRVWRAGLLGARCSSTASSPNRGNPYSESGFPRDE